MTARALDKPAPARSGHVRGAFDMPTLGLLLAALGSGAVLEGDGDMLNRLVPRGLLATTRELSVHPRALAFGIMLLAAPAVCWAGTKTCLTGTAPEVAGDAAEKASIGAVQEEGQQQQGEHPRPVAGVEMEEEAVGQRSGRREQPELEQDLPESPRVASRQQRAHHRRVDLAAVPLDSHGRRHG